MANEPGRGAFMQRRMGKGVLVDPRKDGFVWGVHVRGPADVDGARPFEDIKLELTVRSMDTREIEFFGKGKITGGYRISMSGNVRHMVTSFGTLGDVTEDMVFVRGTSIDTSGVRDKFVNPEYFDIIKIDRDANAGHVEAYNLYVAPQEEGSTRG